MALGGGNFISQNKVLPGTYINFVSAAHASAALSDRGYAAMPLVTGWGIEDEVFTVTSGDFQKNLRAYPGVERGSAEWDETYKIRVNVEKSINHFKDSFCIAGRKTQNEKTLHADLLLAGITQLITVIVADKIHQHQYLRSLKPLIA